MDRRKIVSRNPLHKQLHSSSQIAKKSVVGGLNIVRSVSATNESLSTSRKRKNSEDQENDEDSTSSMSSPKNSLNAKKKKKRNVSDDDESEEEAPPPKRPSPDKKGKEVSSGRKRSDNSDREEENDSGKSNAGSIRGFLEALDKSPAKLSQSSDSSMEKYRKMNLRTPLRTRGQRPVSKAIAEKKGEKAKDSENPIKESRDPRTRRPDLKKILPGPASPKKKTPQKVVSDDEEMISDTEVVPAKKDVNSKKTKPGPASSKKKTPQKDVSDEEIRSDDEFASARKVTKVRKNLSGPASSKKKTQQKDVSDEEMMSDDDFASAKRVTNAKKNLSGPASSKKKPQQKDVSDEEMMSDDDFASAKKVTNARKNLSGPASSKKKTKQKDLSDEEMMSDDDFASAKRVTNVRKNLSGPASSKKKTQQKIVSDDEMTSDTDVTPVKKGNKLKKNLAGPASSKKKAPQKNVSDDEMTSDTDVAPAKKVTNKTKERSPERTPAKSSKAQGSPDKTPPRRRVVDSPELSPLRTFQSPERERERQNVTQRRKKTINHTGDQFADFVNAVGITLCSGDNLHIASDNPAEVIRKMKDLLVSDSIDKDDLVRSWKSYIEDGDNLYQSLLEMRIETDEGVAVCSKAVSLSRILLKVPQLQVDVLRSLFKKLIEAVITSDSSDDAPWALKMLQQFRFLDTIVDPKILVDLIEELLSSSPEWFQREVIVFIPDIVTDTEHRTTAEMLVKIMENNSDLTSIILDCIHNLILGKEYREELREKVLSLLSDKLDKSNVPAITRFVLNSCSTEAIAYKSLNSLRSIDMTPAAKEKSDECFTHQKFMVSAMKMSIHLFKEVAKAAEAVMKSAASKPVPLDIILSILLYETTTARKKLVESTLLGHIKTGHYKTIVLKSFYIGYKSVAKSFQTSALALAIGLLKADNQSYVEFGIEWIRYMFGSQADASHRQREIMEKLLNLMGTKDRTVKNALEVLIRMSNDDNERRYLQQHVGFLRSFLEKIDNLHFEEVANLYHLLHGLCTHSESIANILNDDLSIIMQKQLCSSKVQTKCKGVLGAVMAIKHLACEQSTKDEAYNLLRKTITNLKACKRSETLFYDQLAQVFTTTSDINEEFLTSVANDLEEHFVANCLVEKSPSNNLVPQFSLLDPTELENMAIYFENIKFGACVAALFKLLGTCNLKLHGSLENVDGMLGCPVLLPEDLDMPEPDTADYMIHCINWFREIVGAFVAEDKSRLRDQILQRLERLMNLQGEFVTMVAMLDSRYQPPPCYFDHFPTPDFVRLDLKLGKKGKKGKKAEKKDKQDTGTQLDSTLSKSIVLPEWEIWEKGSQLTVKNPAFFRKMDAKIIHLLDISMDTRLTQSSSGKITIAQVCFIIRELLNVFENQVSESFVKDVISLLPKVCKKLQQIVADLRTDESVHEKEAVRLILCLFICILNWKELPRHNNLLRDGLRALAAMMNEASALLRSCKDLVVEAYSYFESLSDIATQITLAVALVKLCEALMKHSDTFTHQSKDRQAKMAHGFLCLEWNESNGSEYKAAVKELLKSWIENEPDPLKTVSSVLEWLPEELAALEKPQSRLTRMPSVTKTNFHLFLKQLFVGLIKGIQTSLESAESDPERIETWLDAGKCLDKISEICKSNRVNLYLTFYLRYTTILYQILLSSGMPVIEANAKYQKAEVLDIMKLFQKSNRFLRDIFCTARKENNVALLILIPLAKSKREKFIYRVKGMLAANNSIQSFWMGKLLRRDLDGDNLDDESSEETNGSVDQPADNNSVDEMASEILESDSDDDMDIDGD